jgi:hypothetical protein
LEPRVIKKNNLAFCRLIIIILAVLLKLYPCVSRANALYEDSANVKSNRRISFGAYPAIGYKPETSLLVGAVGLIVLRQKPNVYRRFLRPTTIWPYVFYTFKKQFLSYLHIEMYPNNKYYFNGTLKYWNYPDLFFGTGNNTTGANELYTDRITRFEGKFSRIINGDFLAGIAFQFQNNNLLDIIPNGFLDSASVTGKSGGNVFGIGPQLRFDNRDNTLYPTRGFFIESFAIFNPDWKINNYHFNQFSVDFRTYTSIVNNKNILALQAYFISNGGGSIPFYFLAKLGGEQSLRGIEHENRYTDKNAFYIQAEGRRHLFWRFGGVFFTGIGEVSNNIRDFAMTSLKFIYGIGIRYQPLKNEKINIRFDAGKGPDKQYALYFSLNEAF